MSPVKHTAIALGVGTAVWAASGEPLAVPTAIAAGVLIDADHLIDFYLWFKKRDARRLYLILHTWELSAVGGLVWLAFWSHPLLLAAILAHVGHLVGDFVANRPKSILTYSLLFRAVLRFDRDRLIEPPPTLSGMLDHNLPLWHLIEPRLPGKLSRLLGLDP